MLAVAPSAWDSIFASYAMINLEKPSNAPPMNAIYLPGNSIANKIEVEKLSQALSDLFDQSIVQYYRHWQTSEEFIDLDFERIELQKIASNLGEYIIIAKSIGTVLAMSALCENTINPQKCIFLGTPVKWAQEHKYNIDLYLSCLDVPTIFIQHRNDPLTSAQDLQTYLANTSHQVIELPGKTHNYNEYKKLREIISHK